ncbi:MAG: methionyl-tRNA formyltransferase [Phycisphaerae bacterium]|nr:methionyl-tRNA formyltransferase [Phycisphaerae bacterium]
MRIVFIGSGTFALRTFEAVLAAGHEVVAVVTQPPRRAGRGGKLRLTPIEQAAEEAGLDVLPCADINAPDIVAHLAEKQADVQCVVEFGQFIGPAVRQTARLGAFNLHASILPELRGAGPVNWAIFRGMGRTGVSTFSLIDKMDAGPVYFTTETDIGPDERADELRIRLADMGAELVLKTLDTLKNGTAQAVEQDGSKVTFAPKLKKIDGWLDFSAPAERIARIIRGSYPWPGGQAVFHRLSGKKIPVTIGAAEPIDGQADIAPGLIEPDLCISTGEGRLRILEIKPAGKRMMSWKDFCNGYRVVHGGRFTAPEIDKT